MCWAMMAENAVSSPDMSVVIGCNLAVVSIPLKITSIIFEVLKVFLHQSLGS